jgi:hypothetical protein
MKRNKLSKYEQEIEDSLDDPSVKLKRASKELLAEVEAAKQEALKSLRGGARESAGRKRKEGGVVRTSLSLTKKARENLEAKAKAKHVTLSDVVNEWLSA